MLGGKYKVVSMLGVGGMGSVYRVEQVFLHKEFALKTLSSPRTSDASLRRFRVEAKAATLLNHPNLMQFHDFGVLADGRPFLVMDFINGITLAEHLRLHGPLEIQEACRLFAQVCLGLAYAHDQHVVHRDLKPGNIMLVEGARAEECVKVLDFGLAKIMSDDEGEIQSLTRTGEIFGSPLYMSPEQCSSARVDHRSDVYSLGCVLFEALTGAPPHLGNNVISTMMLHQQAQALTLKEASLGKEFPLALEQVVARMLRKSPAERYQNLGHAAHDLAAICRGSVSEILPTKSPSSAGHAPRVISMSAAELCLFLSFAVSIGAGVFGLVNYLVVPKPAAFPKPAQQIQEIRRNEEAPSYEVSDDLSDGVLTKKTTSGTGERDRHFDFPKHYSVGKLLLLNVAVAYGSGTDAKGSVVMTVPEGQGVMLDLNRTSLDNPDLLKSFGAKGITGLRIGSTGSKRAISGKQLMEVLKIASAWPDLNCVCLQLGHRPNHDVVDALSRIKGLRHLVLGGFDESADVPRSFLMQLDSFICMDKRIRANLILKNVVGSHNLKTLGLCADSVSARELMELQQCPQLETLAFDSAHSSIANNITEAMPHLNNVTTIFFEDSKVAPKQMTKLLQAPSISHVILRARDYTPQEVKTLEAMDERIVFN